MSTSAAQATTQNATGAPRGRGGYRGRGRGGGWRDRSNSRNRSAERRGPGNYPYRGRSGSEDKRNKQPLVTFDMVNVGVDPQGDVNIYDDAPNKETAAFNRLVTKFAVEGHRGVATILFDFPSKKERYEQVNNDPYGRIFEDLRGAQEHMAKLPHILHLFKNGQSRVLPCPKRRELASADGPTVNEFKIITRPKAAEIEKSMEQISLKGIVRGDVSA